MSINPAFYFTGLFLFGVTMNIIMQKIFHTFGSWSKLERSFIYQKLFTGKYYQWQSITINRMRYKGSIHIGVDNNGLYMKQFFLIGLFAKPILIPWEKLSYSKSTSRNIWSMSFYTLYIENNPKITITISQNLLDKLEGRVSHLDQ